MSLLKAATLTTNPGTPQANVPLLNRVFTCLDNG